MPWLAAPASGCPPAPLESTTCSSARQQQFTNQLGDKGRPCGPQRRRGAACGAGRALQHACRGRPPPDGIPGVGGGAAAPQQLWPALRQAEVGCGRQVTRQLAIPTVQPAALHASPGQRPAISPSSSTKRSRVEGSANWVRSNRLQPLPTPAPARRLLLPGLRADKVRRASCIRTVHPTHGGAGAAPWELQQWASSPTPTCSSTSRSPSCPQKL